MKYLVLLLLLAASAAYVLWRLRPYIRGARRFIGVVREMRRMQQGVPFQDLPQKAGKKAKKEKKWKKAAQRGEAPAERLVRCAACGTWAPASRAVSLAGGATYCSHACLERAADSPHKARKSAS